jgi:hypothetical protein
MIKIAFATDDVVNISAHLGRAQKYLIYTIENSENRISDKHPHRQSNSLSLDIEKIDTESPTKDREST